jgi:hypothetical protein
VRGLLSAACAALLAAPCAAQAWRGYAPRPGGRPAADCAKTSPAVVGGTQGYSGGLASGLCFVSIEPTAMPGLIYRSYAFFSDGLLMVFSSYGDGQTGPDATSAREFFLFPRRAAPQLALDSKAGAVSVRMSDGARADFDPATGQLSGLERGAVAVSPRIDPKERGGVEITRYAGLLLDAGFRIGESPSGRPDGTSLFRGADGRECEVKNRDLFAYGPGGDHAFKLTDAQLSAWLKTACPGLNAGF